MTPHELMVVRGIPIIQDEGGESPKRIHFVADLSVDVDGARKAYRLDNNKHLALDDIHKSAGWPDGSWWNVLLRDPRDRHRPYVDSEGYCISATSYERTIYDVYDRRRYLDAQFIPYSVIPGHVRQVCKGVLLGCKSRITDIENPDRSITTVCGDFSGDSIGEASLCAAVYFDPQLSARNGDERRRYLYEFFPDEHVTLGHETFQLLPLHASKSEAT